MDFYREGAKRRKATYINNNNNNNNNQRINNFFQTAASSLITGTCQVINNMVSVTRNKGGGKSNNGSGNNNNKNKKKDPPPLPGSQEFQTLLNNTEVEVGQDPYRGLRAEIQSLETGVAITTPWNACIFGSLDPDEDTVEKDCLDDQQMVRHVGGCACPTLKAWTRKKLESIKCSAATSSSNNNKKRKRQSSDSTDSSIVVVPDPPFTVGLRPEDINYQCQCDYNPLCLGTLGGVVNDILKKRCQTMEDDVPSNATSSGCKIRNNNNNSTQSKDEAFVIKDDDEDDNDGDYKPEDVSSPPREKRKPIVQMNKKKAAAKTYGTSDNNKNDENKQPVNHVVIDVDNDVGENDCFDKKEQGATNEMSEDDVAKEKDDDPFAFPDSTPEKREESSIDGGPGSPTMVRSTPLKRRRQEQETALTAAENPADVYSDNDKKTPPDLSKVKYSAATSQELDTLRRSTDIASEDIRSYVYRKLGFTHEPDENNHGLTIDKYMKILEEWHGILTFDNPCTEEERKLPGDKIRLSIPPGIDNLGATCYLNTQLQCLAQNTVFLHGIFSWREVNSTHRMNSVMLKLQHLLAQMVLGGDSKLSTLEFSNALGLEHDEQQDPNEFARLLFERMDESFQQCDGDLANLLQRIFHGTTTYETVCMTCGHSSERNEGFMDLNLPIVKREYNNKKKGGEEKKKASDIRTAFASARSSSSSSKITADTDVQYCLDRYTCVEMLDGDNQYFCGKCNCKRDAKRMLKLTELPPVLNVQLSRYVFDREQFVKKKLSDKVLLPKTLYLKQTQGTKKKYMLCAVMRHQGTSAYRGHYVAEAMDWLTGQWFEFNDSIVKPLPAGPSCSFEPNEDGQIGEENGLKSISGSQDAYNMYYVSESYLVQHAAETIQIRSKLADPTKYDADVVAGKVSQERRSKYAILQQMCFQDCLVSERLRQRGIGIRKYLFPDASSLIPDKISPSENDGTNETVWVSADFLRAFLRCDPDLDRQLKVPKPILKHQELLCSHKRLHPTTARQGKLLPRGKYDAYISLLQGERKLMYEQTPGDDEDLGPVCDCEIIPSNNMFCDICSESYREELKKKLDLLKDIKCLYDAFDSLIDDEAMEKIDDETDLECPEDRFAYAVSRQSFTKFKKSFATLMKTFKDYDEGCAVEKSTAHESPRFDGLDSLDISSFIDLQRGDEDEESKPEVSKSSTEKGTPPDALDKFLNTNITCSHGNSNNLNNKRSVRFVSWEVWQKILKVFPHAIVHKVKKPSLYEIDSSDRDTACPVCQGEKDALDSLKGNLTEWAKGTKQNFELKDLMDGKRTDPRDQDVRNFTLANNGCRLVHRVDIQTWRKGVSAISMPSKTRSMSIDRLKEFVESKVFPNCHATVLDFEKQPVDRLCASLRSLVCREHKRVIKNAIFKATPEIENDGEDSTNHSLSDCIVVLSDVEYRAYNSSLADLLHILYPEKGSCALGSANDPVEFEDEKPYLKEIESITNSYHPAISVCHSDEQKSIDDLLVFSLENNTKEFRLTPAVCSCSTCFKEYAPLMHKVKNEDNEKIESISIDSDDSKPPTNKKPSGSGSARSDPIVVEMDIDDYQRSSPDTFPLRAFEVAQKVDIMETLQDLQQISAVPNDKDSSISSFLRRSTRKRQQRYPSGSLLREDSLHVGMHNNIAAVRLLLFEKCEVPLVGQILTLVLSVGDGTSRFEVLVSEHNEKPLSDLVESLKEKVDDKEIILSDFDPSKHLLFLYQEDPNVDVTGLHDSLMDSFLQMANLGNSEPTNGKKNKKRKRESERGFRGTLLSSSSSVPAGGDDAQKQEDDNVLVEGKDIGETANDNKSESRKMDISEISDEEKDDSSTKVVASPSQQRTLMSDSSSDSEIPDAAFDGSRRTVVKDHPAENARVSNVARVLDDGEDSSSFEVHAVNDKKAIALPLLQSTVAIAESPARDEDGSIPKCNAKFEGIYNLVKAMVTQPCDDEICYRAVHKAITEADLDVSNENEVLEKAIAYYLTWSK